MTLFIWNDFGGGSFSDAQKWYNSASDKVGDGTPGGGDTAVVTGDGYTVTCGGESVGTLNGPSGKDIVTLSGGLSVSGDMDGAFRLTSGTFSANSAHLVRVAGATLSAGILDTVTVTSGEANATFLSNVRVKGGSVSGSTAEDLTQLGGSVSLGDVTLGDIATGHFIGVLGGTFRASSLILTSGSPFEVAGGGRATVTGLTTLQDGVSAAPYIWVGQENITGADAGPGTLSLEGGLLMHGTSGETLTTFAGGITSIIGPAIVDMVSATSNNGIVSNGGTTQISGTLILGDALKGRLNVVNGGYADVERVTAGRVADAEGTVFVSGAGSVLDTTLMLLGRNGTGTLQIEAGGALSVFGSMTLGGLRHGNGTAFIGDEAAGAEFSKLFVQGSLTVGNAGEGFFRVAQTGLVIVNRGLEIGAGTDSTGTVVIDHGAMQVRQFLIGYGDGSFANLSVTGQTGDEQALLKFRGQSGVGFGEGGTASLDITDGGKVLGSPRTSDLLVGSHTNSHGKVYIAGEGSELRVASMQLGSATATGNTAHVTVGDGARLFVAHDTLAIYANGEFDVTGSGTVAIPKGVILADGIFDISLSTNGARIGALSGDSGIVDLGAARLTITAAANDYAGQIMGDGGTVRLEGGTQTLSHAKNDFSGGVVLAGDSTLQLSALRAAGTAASSLQMVPRA